MAAARRRPGLSAEQQRPCPAASMGCAMRERERPLAAAASPRPARSRCGRLRGSAAPLLLRWTVLACSAAACSSSGSISDGSTAPTTAPGGTATSRGTCGALGTENERLARDLEGLRRQLEQQARNMADITLIRDLWKERARVAETFLSPADQASAKRQMEVFVRSTQATRSDGSSRDSTRPSRVPVTPAPPGGGGEAEGASGTYLGGVLMPLVAPVLYLQISLALAILSPLPAILGGCFVRSQGVAVVSHAMQTRQHQQAVLGVGILFALLSAYAWWCATTTADEEKAPMFIRERNVFGAIPLLLACFAVVHVRPQLFLYQESEEADEDEEDEPTPTPKEREQEKPGLISCKHSRELGRFLGDGQEDDHKELASLSKAPSDAASATSFNSKMIREGASSDVSDRSTHSQRSATEDREEEGERQDDDDDDDTPKPAS